MGIVTTNTPLQRDVTTTGAGYHNIFYDWVLAGMKTTLNNEFKNAHTYISPTIINTGSPFSVRIWGGSATTGEESTQQWQKEYNLDVVMYFVEKNPSEKFYRQLYNDAEHLYQLLFNNKTLTITFGGSATPAGPSSAKSFTWISGTVGAIEINSYEEDEEDVDGLHTARLDFSCFVEREG